MATSRRGGGNVAGANFFILFSEFGPFVGISAAAFSQGMNGGFGPSQSGASGTAGLEASARVGVGLEGVLDESGDGLIFAGVGYRQDGPAQGETTIPGRGALTLRVRAPFWLNPGGHGCCGSPVSSCLTEDVENDGSASNAGFDRPIETSVVSPVNAPTPNLRTNWPGRNSCGV